jgi:hypothetical protein
MQNDLESRVRDLEAMVTQLIIASRGHQGAIEGLINLAEADQQEQQQPAQGAPLSRLN